jgi:hypothetical protein
VRNFYNYLENDRPTALKLRNEKYQQLIILLTFGMLKATFSLILPNENCLILLD